MRASVHNCSTMKTVTLTPTQRAFAADLAMTSAAEGGWTGPRGIDSFTTENWQDFAAFLRRDDGSLSAADMALCEEMAEAIDAALDAPTLPTTLRIDIKLSPVSTDTPHSFVCEAFVGTNGAARDNWSAMDKDVALCEALEAEGFRRLGCGAWHYKAAGTPRTEMSVELDADGNWSWVEDAQ